MDNATVTPPASGITYQRVYETPLLVPRMFPGNVRQPCAVRYTMLGMQKKDSESPDVAIVVIQGPHMEGTSYGLEDEGRDILINALLKEAVPGVRLDFVHIIFIDEKKPGVSTADELFIQVTEEAIKASGIPHTIQKKSLNDGLKEKMFPSGSAVSWLSYELVAGSAEVYTDYFNFNAKRSLAPDEIEAIYTAIGLPFPGMNR